MIHLRKSDDRGQAKIGWLDSKHTFSFGNYYDPENMGFGALRVINEDIVDAAAGFPTHPHRDMEIITYVMNGALEHKDSLGTGSRIVPGDVQRMSAGTGIFHSEFNPMLDEPAHLLQIWIIPNKDGLNPSYEQKNFSEKRKPGTLTLLVSPDGRDGSLTMHQDAFLYVLDLNKDQAQDVKLDEGRMAWVQVAKGSASLNGQALEQGDGAAVTKEKLLSFTAGETSEILIFDLASRVAFH
ncbi:MAG: pirin family protein [Rickettsiales bacterium]